MQNAHVLLTAQAIVVNADVWVPLVATLIMGLIGGYVRQLVKTVTAENAITRQMLFKHLEECDKINKEVLETRLNMCEREIMATRRFSHWIANAITAAALKLDIQLSPRPE